MGAKVGIAELTEPQGAMFCMREWKIPFPLFVGGYGCGKSEIMVKNAVRDIMLFPGCYVGCYAPTLDLLFLNIIPRIELELTIRGIPYVMNAQKKIMFVRGGRQFIFRSMDNPGRIVAYEVHASHVDEADLMTTAKKGEEVWNRIIARNRQKWVKRNGKTHKRHFNMVSAYTTPEGFKFTYNRWKKEPGIGYNFVQAPTSSNWTLDKSFIENLENSYTPEQCKAYLEGYWTNIFTGTVYSYFDRERHHTDRILMPNERVYVGCDFNYGGSCGSIYVPETNASLKGISIQELDMLRRGAVKPEEIASYKHLSEEVGLSMVDEFCVMDTEQMVQKLQDEYHGRIIDMYPDATGTKNATNASMSDIAMLKSANFNVVANASNPRIVDRINAMQRMLYQDLWRINVDKCPKSTEAMEEHAYSDTTGLPDKFAGPGTIDDWNDSAGYCPAFKYPIKKITTTTKEI